MKTILIVGGSRGIGANVLAFQRNNHHCINISRSAPINHQEITHYSCDVLQDELPEFEAIDGLVYCPGSINLKPISSLSSNDFQSDFEINVLGAIRVIKNYLPILKKSSSASIVLFSSVAANAGMPFHASVSASKGAIESMTRALAAELSPTIRVNCVAPSLTDTPLAERLLKTEKQRENASERHPLKRIGETDDIAHAVDFLLHEKSAWVTGQIIRVDGGMSAINL